MGGGNLREEEEEGGGGDRHAEAFGLWIPAYLKKKCICKSACGTHTHTKRTLDNTTC